MAGEESLSARSSPAIEKQCPRCGIGRLRPTDDGLECYNCAFIEYTEDPPTDDPESLFTRRQKDQILDALQEQYMRTRGNARRSKLESSKKINEEHAAFIDDLMEYVKGL